MVAVAASATVPMPVRTRRASARTNDGTERLAAAVRQALDEAKESLASAATTAELREFVDRWVGPMVLKPDGSVVERTLATEGDSEASVKGLVAGAGFEPATFGL